MGGGERIRFAAPDTQHFRSLAPRRFLAMRDTNGDWTPTPPNPLRFPCAEQVMLGSPAISAGGLFWGC
jgi:hypothetical protein